MATRLLSPNEPQQKDDRFPGQALFHIPCIGGKRMNYRISSNPATTFLAFLAGAALGGVVVALTTPKRGADLRQDLSRLGGQAKDQVGEWAEAASGAMEEITTVGKEKADHATAQVKAKAEEVADKGQQAWKEIKKGTSSAGSDLKDGLTAAGKELRT